MKFNEIDFFRMTYRHLEVTRTEELITEVEKFVKVLLILLRSLMYVYVNE